MQYKELMFNIMEIGVVVGIIVSVIRYILDKIKVYNLQKHGITKQIANSAYLNHKTIIIDDKTYQDEKYQAVYLIQYDDYDIEIAMKSPNESMLTVNYPIQPINDCSYILVDISSTDLQINHKYAIEDNYTKAILIVEPSTEYFYLNLIHPKITKDDEQTSFYINKTTGLAQITRDDLKYYKILGEFSVLIKNMLKKHG